MQRSKADQALFEKVVEIKNEINKQIPFASNRFEEYECPPVGEHPHDIDIQFYLHEQLWETATLNYVAMDELQDAYFDFIEDQGLPKGKPLTHGERVKLENFLATRMNAIYSRLSRIYEVQGLLKKDEIPLAKVNIQSTILEKLADVCEQGAAAALVDEEKMIEKHVQGLRARVRWSIKFIKQQKGVEMWDLRLLDRYRREGTPHEDAVNELYSNLLLKKHIPSAKVTIDPAAIDYFYQDAMYNIDRFASKVRARRYTFRQRFESDSELADLRYTIVDNLATTNLDALLKAYNPAILKSPEILDSEAIISAQAIDDLEKKSIESLRKSLNLQKGLYYILHKTKVGYCDEHAELAIVKLLDDQYEIKDRIEKVSISYTDGDGHTFVVINRAEGSELHDMRTWGERAILLDAWHQLACYVTDFDKQGRDYFSFPREARWTSLSFGTKDARMLRQIKTMSNSLVNTGNLNPENREARLTEEYQLQPIPAGTPLLAYLEEVIAKYKPQDFKYSIQFSITPLGNELIKFVPGFRAPMIALHAAIFPMLIEGKLSLSGCEFEIAVTLLKLKMFTNFISPSSISHESQQRLDRMAMEMIESTEAAIEYLRCAASVSSLGKPIVMADYYESEIAGFNLRYITSFTYVERIKVLQASIAAGIVKSFNQEIKRPSPAFRASLVQLIEVKPAVPSFIQVDPLIPPPETMAAVTLSEPVKAPAPDITPEELAKQEAAQRRVNTLHQLLKQLPELKIELLPYEDYKAPSLRLREFGEIVKSLKIDYNNPAEAIIVDIIIDQAHELKIPGFEYLYYAFAGRWSLGSRGRAHVAINNAPMSEYSSNMYYLTLVQYKEWDLKFCDENKRLHAIPIRDVDGLQYLLDKAGSNIEASVLTDRIDLVLQRYEGMRPLGFFKTIQRLITAFTLATSYEEARERAQELASFRQKYIAHLNDDDFEVARFQKREPNAERLFGSNLGKYIKWDGFEVRGLDYYSEAPYMRFLPWATKDKEGLIASTLFRLGVNNMAPIIEGLTAKELFEIGKKYSYHAYTFLGFLTGVCTEHMRVVNFEQLSVWLIELQSSYHKHNDEAIEDKEKSFEERFIWYFDANKPQLIRPDLSANQNNVATLVLLEQFMLIATKGSDEEKAVVKGFFLGREDNRDLKTLLKKDQYHGYLAPHSNYASFILLQTYQGNNHSLFDQQEVIRFLRLGLVLSYSFRDVFGFEYFCELFRLPKEQAAETSLFLMLALCKENEFAISEVIIARYFAMLNEVHMFSPVILRLLDVSKESKCISFELRRIMNKAIWPALENNALPELSIDSLIYQYSVFDLYAIFPSYKIRAKFGALVLSRINRLPSNEERLSSLERWLFCGDKLPITDVNLKNKLIDQLVAMYASKQGLDDGSDTYFHRVHPLITKLYNNLHNRDLQMFMSRLLTAIEAQRKLAERVGVYVDPADFKLFSSKRFKAARQSLVTLIKAADLFGKEAKNQEALLNYFSSPFTQQMLDQMVEHVSENINVAQLSCIFGWSLTNFAQDKKVDKVKAHEKLGAMLMTAYFHFWDCNLYERAAVIEQLIIPASKTLTVELQTIAYEKGLAFVTKKLFPKVEDEKSEDYLAFCIMKSYLQTADNFIRSYLLTAILVAANQESGQETSIGKKLAIVCEHMGPAHVKLAQLVHSHPSTSKEIRADLAHVKGKANPPHRWSLWRQMAEVLLPADLASIKRLGKLLGSASYNLALEVTLQNNETMVLLMLRENAEQSARKGFSHIRATIMDCQHPTVVNQQLVMSQIIDEAAHLSENEMNRKASDKQAMLAEGLYTRDFSLLIAEQRIHYKVRPASIIRGGNGYRFIAKMEGEEFNCLPDTTPKERFLKRAVAKAVVMMELHNILRGGQFDSDRHGNQLRIQVLHEGEINGKSTLHLHLGLYDFGEMALSLPTERDLYQLADILTRTALFKSFDTTIDEHIAARIDLAVKRGESTAYLMRLRKAFLALHDFKAYLERDDLIDIFNLLAAKKDIHPLVQPPLQRAAFVFNSLSSLQRATQFFSQFRLFRTSETTLPAPQPLTPPQPKGNLS